MTDRLSTLLRDEADAVRVPPPPTADVLRRGRAVRRRHQAVSTLTALAVVGVVAGTALVATRDGADRGSEQPAQSPGVLDTGATFTVGTTLWYDDASRSAPIPDAAVKSLYYTSAGVLVRHGDTSWSDGGGEQRFSLVTPDGEVRPVGVATEEVAHTTDPAQPYLAWTQAVDGVAQVVVHDVAADEEVARVPLPDVDPESFLWTTLSGDTAYVMASGEPAAEVDWRTGEVAAPSQPVYDIGGDHADVGRRIIDLGSGEVLYESASPRASVDLSPDGRYVLVSTYRRAGTLSQVHDLVEGDATADLAGLQPYSWTAGSRLFNVDDEWVTTCDPDTGECSGVQAPHGANGRALQETLKLGGTTYES